MTNKDLVQAIIRLRETVVAILDAMQKGSLSGRRKVFNKAKSNLRAIQRTLRKLSNRFKMRGGSFDWIDKAFKALKCAVNRQTEVARSLAQEVLNKTAHIINQSRHKRFVHNH